MSESRAWEIALAEVCANLRAGTWRTALVVVTALVMGVLSTGLSAADAIALQAQWTKVELAGRSTYVATGNGSVLTAAQCDHAATLNGVVSAGGVLSQRTVSSPTSPSYSFGLIRSTPGFARAVWVSDLARSDVVAGPELAAHLGLSGGRFLSIAESGAPSAVLPVNATMSTPSRLTDADNSVVVPARAVGVVAACYIRTIPAKRRAAGRLIQSYFGSGVTVSSTLPPTGLVSDPDAAFASRPSNWCGPAAGILLLLLELISLFGRREGFALYRVSGLPRTGLLLMLGMETAIMVVLPFQSAALWGTLAAVHAAPVVAVVTLIEDVKALCVLTLTPLLGLLLIDKISPIAAFRGY